MIIGIALIAFSSCSSKDKQFCKCLEAGEKLNNFASELLERGATKEDEAKIKELREVKDKECANYQTMGGEEMKKKQAECN